MAKSRQPMLFPCLACVEDAPPATGSLESAELLTVEQLRQTRALARSVEWDARAQRYWLIQKKTIDVQFADAHRQPRRPHVATPGCWPQERGFRP